jgi:hypothetical protein
MQIQEAGDEGERIENRGGRIEARGGRTGSKGREPERQRARV